MSRRLLLPLLAASLAGACACAPEPRPGAHAGPADAGPADAGPADAGVPDAGGSDGGSAPVPRCPATSALPGWVAPADGAWTATCGSLRIDLELREAGTLGLRYRRGAEAPARSYAVVGARESVAAQAGANDGRFALCTEALALELAADGRVRVADRDGQVLLEDPAGGGFFQGAGGEIGLVRAAAPGERWLGLGEKTGALDRRGRILTMRNTDAFVAAHEGYPPDADPLYQSIPLMVALRDGRSHGVFTDDPWRLRFDLAAGDPHRWKVTAAGGQLVQYVLAGPTMADVLRRYTALTGRMPLPPRWALGYHQSRWGYAPDTEVRAVAAELRARSIPADGMWLDIQHLDGLRSFTWDPAKFPDPSRLVADLAAQGFKTTVIADPGIKKDAGWDIYLQGVSGGHFLKRADGSVFIGTVWPGESAFPDFTRAATRDWWAGLVARPLAHGVRGVWIDMNEPATFDAATQFSVPDDLPADGDGTRTTMGEAHNVYALLEARATRDGMLAAAPDRRPFVLTRAGYAGIQRHAAVWTGDAPSTWATLRGSLPMLLGMGVSGLPFVGTDVGGYSGRASAELFARWMQLGSISPFFRAHTMQDGARQEPWRFGQEVEDISRAVIEDRYRLLPYLYSLFHEAAQTGAPVLRPLAWEFPEAGAVDDVALLGPWLLYAPVVQEGASARTVTLPAGRWFEPRSGAVREGPTTFAQTVTLAALPAWVREGALLPSVEPMPFSDHHAPATLWLDAYAAGRETSFTLYEDDGDSHAYRNGQFSLTAWTASRSSTGASISQVRTGGWTPPPRTLVVRVRRVDSAPTGATLDGEALAPRADRDALLAAGSGWCWDREDRAALAAFPDRAAFALRLAYDPALEAPAPSVAVRFEVTLPAGTPDGPVHIATSADGWQAHLPLARTGPTSAAGAIPLPRGEWFFYKFTRGAWPTVEMWPGCVEASNRYGFAAAHPVRRETVHGWHDRCP